MQQVIRSLFLILTSTHRLHSTQRQSRLGTALQSVMMRFTSTCKPNLSVLFHYCSCNHGLSGLDDHCKSLHTSSFPTVWLGVCVCASNRRLFDIFREHCLSCDACRPATFRWSCKFYASVAVLNSAYGLSVLHGYRSPSLC